MMTPSTSLTTGLLERSVRANAQAHAARDAAERVIQRASDARENAERIIRHIHTPGATS
ncbi:MAG: hypothetical protein ACU0CI_05265 [Shimia sp.]